MRFAVMDKTLERLVVESPEQFKELGLSIEPDETLLADPVYASVEAYLLRKIEEMPKLKERPPRPYQLRYAVLGCLRANNLFAHEAGTGKSYEAILMIMGIFKEQLSSLKPGTIHILAPRHTLNLVWKKKELAKAGLDVYAEVIDGERMARLSKAPIWIYHYDLLKKQTAKGRKSSRPTGEPLFKLFYKRFPPSLLIIDEIHRLKVGTQRTHAVKELRKKAKRVLGLTGTPMDGWVEHLSAILSVIYREKSPEFPFTASEFTRRFTRVESHTRDFVTGEEDKKQARKRPAPGVAADQMPSFHSATKHLIHRLTFKDQEVSPHVQFPATEGHVIEVIPSDAHKAFYESIHNQMVLLIRYAIEQMDLGKISRIKTRQNVLTHLNVLRAAVNHPWEMSTPLAEGGTCKVDLVNGLCQDYCSQNRKVIVYTNRIATGNRIVSVLQNSGLKVLRIYDSDPNAKPKKLSQRDREDRIEEFQEDDSVNVLVGNLDLVSEGLTLVEASVVIHHDHDWRSIAWSQGNNRVVRPGQLYDPVPVYDLIMSNTVDRYIYDAMIRKARATSLVIDREFDSAETAVIDPLEVARNLIQEG